MDKIPNTCYLSLNQKVEKYIQRKIHIIRERFVQITYKNERNKYSEDLGWGKEPSSFKSKKKIEKLDEDKKGKDTEKGKKERSSDSENLGFNFFLTLGLVLLLPLPRA